MPRAVGSAFLFAAASLFLSCGDNERATGEVVIATSFAPADNCPSISWAVAAPAQTSVGSKIAVAAAASDPDLGDVLAYSWTPAEAFLNPKVASTSYLCGSAGAKTLNLTVTDHHHPTPCAATTALRITCVAAKAGPGF